MKRVYDVFGGRKNANTYLLVAILLGYAALTRPDFLSFAAAVGGALLGGSFLVAFEDRARK